MGKFSVIFVHLFAYMGKMLYLCALIL